MLLLASEVPGTHEQVSNPILPSYRFGCIYFNYLLFCFHCFQTMISVNENNRLSLDLLQNYSINALFNQDAPWNGQGTNISSTNCQFCVLLVN